MKTEEGVGVGMKIKQDNKDEAKPTPKVVMTKQMWCVIFIYTICRVPKNRRTRRRRSQKLRATLSLRYVLCSACTVYM